MASRMDPRAQYHYPSHPSQYPRQQQQQQQHQHQQPPPLPPSHHPPPPSAHHHPPPASYPPGSSASSYPGYHDPSAPDASGRALPRITPGPSPNGHHLAPHQQHQQLRSSAPAPHLAHNHHGQPYYPLVPQPHPSPPPPHPDESSIQAHQQDLDESPLDGSFVDPNDPKRARACESCRGLKVRCDRDPNNKDQPCLRCAKAKRPCIVTEPSRKRQKKTDSRVAELERKIERLSALLPAHVQELESPQHQDANDDDSTASDSAQSPASSKQAKRRRTATTSPSQDSAKSPVSSTEPREFVTARRERQWSAGSVEPSEKRFRPPHATIPEGCNPPEDYDADAPEPVSAFVRRRTAEIVDDDAAAGMFEHYVVNMAVHMPAIVFPKATRAKDIRESRPLLFLSILVAASVGRAPQAMQFELHALLLSTLADSLIGNVEKGLDVVQALLVATIWYRPPRRYEQMNFYQLAHSAAIMAIDLGLGKRSPVPKPNANPSQQSSKPTAGIPDSLEVRRTWLGCYFQCAQISMCLRRPPLIRWTNYLEESVELLETSSDAFESDKLLCQHVKLQHLSEQIGQRFSMDDPSAQISITDPKIQDSIRIFEVELGSWRKSAERVIWNTQLEISEKVVSLYMHETALHIGHNVDDFRAPFTEEMVRASAGQGLALSPAHSTALLDCLRAVHAIFDNFFTFDLSVVRNLPIFFFVRVGYAVVVLARLHFAVMAPKSDISKLISQEDVAVESYFGRLLKIFQSVHEQESFRPATRFLVIVRRLFSCFTESRQNESKKTKDGKHDAGQKRQRGERPATQTPSSSSKSPTMDMRASTPLDVLSQVATAGVDGQSSMPIGNKQPAGMAPAKAMDSYGEQNNPMWYGSVAMPNMATPGAGEFGVGMDFSSAIDMTLSGVIDDTADLSWLFNDGYGGNMWSANG